MPGTSTPPGADLTPVSHRCRWSRPCATTLLHRAPSPLCARRQQRAPLPTPPLASLPGCGAGGPLALGISVPPQHSGSPTEHRWGGSAGGAGAGGRWGLLLRCKRSIYYCLENGNRISQALLQRQGQIAAVCRELLPGRSPARGLPPPLPAAGWSRGLAQPLSGLLAAGLGWASTKPGLFPVQATILKQKQELAEPPHRRPFPRQML